MPSIAPGLHLIATPIGTARDITLRALDLLAGCDVLVAEDTRSLRRLMDLHGIALNGRRVQPYHDHNGAVMRPRLLTGSACGTIGALCIRGGHAARVRPRFRAGPCRDRRRAAGAGGPGRIGGHGRALRGRPAQRQVLLSGISAGTGRRTQADAGRGGRYKGNAYFLRIAATHSPFLRGIARLSGEGQTGRTLPRVNQVP